MTSDLFTACLGLSVTGPLDETRLDRVRGWLRAVARRTPVWVPPMLTMDLGTLMIEGPRPLSIPEVGSQDELRAALASYAEHIVGRVRAEPALMPLTDAVAEAPDPATAVQVVVGRLAEVLLGAVSVEDLGTVRRQIGRPTAELIEGTYRGLGHPEIRAGLAKVLLTMVHAAKRQPALLRSTDAFVVRHLDALKTPSDQLAFAQIADAAAALSHFVPRRVRARRPASGAAPTALDDESAYPVGGYSALATHGPLENLVSTELVYLEPEAELDLFDLRYVTGELLKYTRDESLWMRPHRRIDFVLPPETLGLQVKVPTLPFQNSVMAQGLLIVCIDRLLDWLSASDLELRVWVMDPQEVYEDDLARLQLVLADSIALGVAQVEQVPSWDALAKVQGDVSADVVVLGDPATGYTDRRPATRLGISTDGRCEGPPTHDGRPMTAHVKSWGASATAVLAGLL